MKTKLPLPRWRVKSSRGGYVIEVNHTGRRFEWLDGRLFVNKEEALDEMAKLTGPPKFLHLLRYAHLDPDNAMEEVQVQHPSGREAWFGQHPTEDMWLIEFKDTAVGTFTAEAKDFEMCKRVLIEQGYRTVLYIGQRGG